jgi:hypothetical protein
MRSVPTTLEYRPLNGLFTVTAHLSGHPRPLVKMVPEFDLRRIGDQDLNAAIEEAKMFPNHPHVVPHIVPQRRAA